MTPFIRQGKYLITEYTCSSYILFFFQPYPRTFLSLLLFFFKEREWCEREISIGCLLLYPYTQEWTRHLRMFVTDQESNLGPLHPWDNTLTNWATLASLVFFQMTLILSAALRLFTSLLVQKIAYIIFPFCPWTSHVCGVPDSHIFVELPCIMDVMKFGYCLLLICPMSI